MRLRRDQWQAVAQDEFGEQIVSGRADCWGIFPPCAEGFPGRLTGPGAGR
jgi:hypothetical protein